MRILYQSFRRSIMNYAALVLIIAMNDNKVWADYDEDDPLPPLPMSWIQGPHEDDLWTTVTKKKTRGVNSAPLGVRRK